jgi:hypothetical protein
MLMDIHTLYLLLEPHPSLALNLILYMGFILISFQIRILHIISSLFAEYSE